MVYFFPEILDKVMITGKPKSVETTERPRGATSRICQFSDFVGEITRLKATAHSSNRGSLLGTHASGWHGRLCRPSSTLSMFNRVQIFYLC